MSERSATYRPKAVLAATLAAATLLTACGTTSGEAAKGNAASYSSSGQTPEEFVHDRIVAGAAKKCLGHASLRGDGNMRTSPDSREYGNLISAYSSEAYNQVHNLVVQTPLQIDGVINEDSTSSHTWYVAALANGQLAFTNEDALLDTNLLKCSKPATVETELGKILVDPSL